LALYDSSEVKSTDERIRNLERLASQGDEEAIERLKLEDVRTAKVKSRPLLRVKIGEVVHLVGDHRNILCLKGAIGWEEPSWGPWRIGELLEEIDGACEWCDAKVSQMTLESFHALIRDQVNASKALGVTVPSEEELGIRILPLEEIRRRRRVRQRAWRSMGGA
jgi:hypothetical protein